MKIFKIILVLLILNIMFSCKSLSSVASVSTKSTVQVSVILNKTIQYKDYFDEPENSDEKIGSLGSGFIVKKAKDLYYVITNYHVIKNYKTISIQTYDDQDFDASLVGYDESLDLALLSIKTDKHLKVAKLGNSEKLKVGAQVFAIGSPLQYDFTLTAGVVSYLLRQNGPDSSIQDYIQTDVTINAGNSGGPLFNMSGEVVGINNWIRFSGSGQNTRFANISFSIPINNTKKPIKDFINYGKVRYKWLGANMFYIFDLISKNLNEKIKHGVLIENVYTNSPAFKADIRPGDVILKVNKKRVENPKNVSLKIGLSDENADITVLRDKKILNKNVKLEIKKEDNDLSKDTKYLYPGLYIIPILYSIKREYKIDRDGVFVLSIFPNTPASKSSLKANDLITSVNNIKMKNIKDFYSIVSKYKNLDITYFRKGKEFKTHISYPG